MTDKITKAYNTIHNFCLDDGYIQKQHVLEQSLKIIKDELDRVHALQMKYNELLFKNLELKGIKVALDCVGVEGDVGKSCNE